MAIRNDVVRMYRWLGHHSWSEANAIHQGYRPGEPAWNREQQTYPIIVYTNTEEAFAAFVRQYATERLVLIGLNPRPAIFRTMKGTIRSATEGDIVGGQSLMLDIDLARTVMSSRLTALERVLDRADEYFQRLGLRLPARAFTGRGYHLLFAYPPITIMECPDLAHRQRLFKDEFVREFRQDLAAIVARVDNTQDLRRMARVYGTRKPGTTTISQFFGSDRVEDPALRQRLLSYHTPSESEKPGLRKREMSFNPTIASAPALPAWFADLLDHDDEIKRLWRGHGKPPHSDTSASGYDYTLVQALIEHGHDNPDDLAAILTLRPGGKAARADFGYVRRTIMNAHRQRT